MKQHKITHKKVHKKIYSKQSFETSFTSEIENLDHAKTLTPVKNSEIEYGMNPLDFVKSELCDDTDYDLNLSIKQELEETNESDHEPGSIKICSEDCTTNVTALENSDLAKQPLELFTHFIDSSEDIKKEIKKEILDENETKEINNLKIFTCEHCNRSFKEKQLLEVHKWMHT